jgi:hypothetical protein
MAVTGQRMTAEELWQMPDDGMRHELVNGELTSLPLAGSEHGWAALNAGSALREHVRARGLGRVYGAETGFLLARAGPPVCARRRLRAPGAGRGRRTRRGLLGRPSRPGRRGRFPERPSHGPRGEDRHVAGLRHAHGTRNLPRRAPSPRPAARPPRGLTEADTINGDDVMPGWTLPLAELFA